MQSSPPTRRYERPESPANDSKYSLDLAALELDSRSGASSPRLPSRQIDRVLSEDIDGPSDFTQNMEYWMRGTALPNDRNGSARSAVGAVDARELSTAARVAEGGDEQRSASHHTPTGTPPKESVSGPSQQEGGDTAGSSDWDPYVQEATPMPPPHRQFLQPTVEDYHSELTPARAFKTNNRPLPEPQLEASFEPPHEDENSEPSTLGRPSSETVSPVRSPAVQRSQPRQFSSQSEESSYERQVQELHNTCRRLEHLNTALHATVDEERRLRLRDHEDFERKLSEASGRERELFDKASRASVQDRSYQRDVADHQHQLQKRDAALERLRREYSSLQQQMSQHKVDYEQEIKAMEHDIDLANQSRDDALDAARNAQEDMAKIRAAKDTASHHDTSLRARLSELQEQLRNLSLENDSARSARITADEIASGIRAELTLLRQTHAEETTRLNGDHRRAVGMAEDLQRQLRELRRELLDQQAVHEAQLDRLRGAPLPTLSANRGDDDDSNSRDDLDAKQEALNTAIFERDALQDELDSVKAELDTTREALATSEKDLKEATSVHTDDAEKDMHVVESLMAELETSKQVLSKTQQDLKVANIALAESKEEFREMESELYGARLDYNHNIATNRALDAERMDALETNEAYWKGKWATAQEERKIMVKELFRMWGREECGIADTSKGEVQMYRYKYVKRDRSKDKNEMGFNSSPERNDIRKMMEAEMRARKNDAAKVQAMPNVLSEDKGLGNARKTTQRPCRGGRLSDDQIEELIAQHRALKAADPQHKSPSKHQSNPTPMRANSDGESDTENLSHVRDPKHVRREKVARARTETLARVNAEFE